MLVDPAAPVLRPLRVFLTQSPQMPSSRTGVAYAASSLMRAVCSAPRALDRTLRLLTSPSNQQFEPVWRSTWGRVQAWEHSTARSVLLFFLPCTSAACLTI